MDNGRGSLIAYNNGDFPVGDLDSPIWKRANRLIVTRLWNGLRSIPTQIFSADLIWTDLSLYVRFETDGGPPFVAAAAPKTNAKTIGLWERDVCEIFIAPDKGRPRKYFEFEIAPTSEWLDLAIDSTSGERVTDWDYASGMEAAARIEKDRAIMAMKIPWEAFGKKPKAGDVWLGNIFRCVGREPDRGYLAWRPTMTETPNFHIPEAFGEFVFVSDPAA